MGSEKTIIVPHTHWDREWYLPFQRFRYMLVELIDELLEILKKQDYRFMLDGQTVILEDYFEIREERKEEVLKHIRDGKITVGPWYLLPDQWLVGDESLIRNIEYSHDLTSELHIPQMPIGYLPDMFGHSSAIPQMLSNLTDFKAAVLWRGIPPEIMTVLFNWKSHPSSTAVIPAVYLPGGYGNTSRFVEEYKDFIEIVKDGISFLDPYSPVPVYLMMNGSDHLFPQAFVQKSVDRMRSEGFDISLGSLTEYIEQLQKAVGDSGYIPPLQSGEFRSPARAPLLQDTYSARMWIKIWNQKVEDMLVRQVEPLSTYLWLFLKQEYPTSYLKTAWKWLLRNHPHDSICGCSVDTTHEEMKSRFSWAETIGESLLEKAKKILDEKALESESDTSSVLVYNSGGSMDSPVLIEFSASKDRTINGLKGPDGTIHAVQRLESRDDIFFEITVGMRMARMSMGLLPGRKLMNFYINDIEFFEGENPEVLELRFISDLHPIGDLDMQEFKRNAREITAGKKYKKIHLVAARPTQNIYSAVIPLQSWAFSEFVPVKATPKIDENEFLVNQNQVDNRYYSVSFNKDGSLNLYSKELELTYDKLHFFEDYGDRGDEYTFGRVGPERVDVKKVKRHVAVTGPVLAEIRQDMEIEVFENLDNSREKRKGKVRIPIESIFRFYRDTPRIEVTTRLTNRSKDHRLRICFDLPFTSEKSKTATHFGVVERDGAPAEVPDADILERTSSSFPELPSGIQPQKRFIRVDDDKGNGAITVFNTGLPEVELADENRIAVTLIRSVGWLSRADIPERPVHAGPGKETPGAQELGTEYEFHYGFAVHSNDKPISVSADIADAASEKPLTLHLNQSDEFSMLFNPIIQIDNPSIRISSMRVRNDAVLVTMFNLENKEIAVTLNTQDSFETVTESKIDGTKKSMHTVDENQVSVVFSPREIKMCVLK
ncbi:MAG: glycoside hydrolase family 38 C-terminal domain-containing protein [Candidatus Thorarchaeota archaeon]